MAVAAGGHITPLQWWVLLGFVALVLVVFSAGWLSLLVHVLRQFQQQKTDNVTGWGAFLQGIGENTVPFAAGWAIGLAGLAAIGWGVYTQLINNNGIPSIMATAQTWVSAHPEATAETFNQFLLEQLNTASPALQAQLDTFSHWMSMGILAASVWVAANLFWPAVHTVAPGPWWQSLWRGYGVFLTHWPVYILGVVGLYVLLLVGGLLAGSIPFIGPIIWMVWLFMTAWVLLYVCQCVLAVAKPWQPAQDDTPTPPPGNPIADA